MKKPIYHIKGKVVKWPGEAAWYFVGIGKEESKDIKKVQPKPRKGFGSVPVNVTIRTTTWNTSIFPDKHSGMYLLPLKASIRKVEDIEEEDMLSFSIILR